MLVMISAISISFYLFSVNNKPIESEFKKLMKPTKITVWFDIYIVLVSRYFEALRQTG